MTQGMTISEQAKTLAKKVLDQPATEHDIAVVERQLGRYPRGMVAVGARCVCGSPLAVVTRPLLPGGVPFPTTCYLTGPEAVKAISHIEAEGKMKEYNDLLAEDDDLKAPTSVRTNCIWRSGMKSPLHGRQRRAYRRHQCRRHACSHQVSARLAGANAGDGRGRQSDRRHGIGGDSS